MCFGLGGSLSVKEMFQVSNVLKLNLKSEWRREQNM